MYVNYNISTYRPLPLLKIAVFSSLLLLGACAPSLNMYEMMPKSQSFDSLLNNKKFAKSITAGQIVADKNVGGMTAPIDSEQYRESIIFSLRQAGFYNTPDQAKYILDARLIKVDQPLIGFDMTVKTTAEYLLRNQKSGETVYKDTLTLPCTIRFAEALSGEIRLRKATGCSVGENTTHFMKVLNSK